MIIRKSLSDTTKYEYVEQLYAFRHGVTVEYGFMWLSLNSLICSIIIARGKTMQFTVHISRTVLYFAEHVH